MEEIEVLIKKGISKKIEQLNNLNNLSIKNSKEILINNISKYSISNLNNDFSGIGENIIYQINSKELTISYEELKNTFDALKKKYKNNGKEYHISKINEKHWSSELSNYCLYIGSKRNDAITRFKQHLGINIDNRSVYSLYLSDWWPDNIELQIKIYEFGKSINQNSLQIIEDILWEEYKPLLGKQGPNNM